MSDDLMSFIGEDGQQPKASEAEKSMPAVWRILITDDEEDVHSATAFALRNTKILGRRLEFLHANSADEALKILKAEDNIAVIILDVVMETPNAGLDLVAVIRQELGNEDSRIILRTGQPNQAPEIEVIRDYDINDYKLKSELTQNKLYASLTTAVRSYQQIKTIEAGKKGLRMIVKASADLMSKQGLHDFAQGVIVQLAALLGLPPEGLICVRRNNQINSENANVEIIAAAGHYCRLIDHPLSDMEEDEAKQMLVESLDNKCNVYGAHGIALYLGSQARCDTSCYVDSAENIRDVDRDLLELFVSNISVCADNLELIDRLKNFAFRDSLVGLPNRNALNERLAELKGSIDASGFSLAMLNIDGFAELSASLDREGGDNLIKEISKRLRSAFPDTELVARLEGDSFAVLGSEPSVTSASIMAVFEENFVLDNFNKKANITGGIVPLKAVEGDEDNALKYAGAILKQAKAQNRGSVIVYQYERD